MKWTGEQLTSDLGFTAAVQPSSSLYMVCCCLVMLAFVWLFWRLFHVTLGSPVLRPTWSEEKKSAMNGVPSHSFHRLPVFLHAPTQLVPQELFRPSPHRGPLPAGLTGLLVPPLRQHHSVPDKVARAVEAWCGTEMVSVRVDRILLRAWSVPSLFQIGSCTPSAMTPRYLYFHFGMLECGGQVQVAGGQLVYSYLLNYTPPPQGFVIRVSPINLPIHCYYNRFHYSYKVGFRPQVQHTTFLKSLKSKLTFSLTVCNARWEPLSPGHTFFLGEQVYFLARAGTLLAGERLYVDSCQATSSEDPSSLPSMDIITNYGCMTDGRREGSNSQFLSGGGSVVKFSVDAFLFTGVSQVQYLHCTLSVGLTTSNIAKSCNFNKATVRWEELTALPSVCSCCDSVCTNTDMSVKNHVRSSGWIVEKNWQKPTARLRSFKAEEEREHFDKKITSKDNFDVEKESQTFNQDRSGFKDSESVAGRKEWRLTAVPVQEKVEEEHTEKEVKVMEIEGGELKALLTNIMSDQARSHNNETGEVGEEGPSFKNTLSSLSIDYKSSDALSYGFGARRNDSLGIEYDPSTPGFSSDVSTVVNAINTLCPHSNGVRCRAVYNASQEEKDGYHGGHGTMHSTVGTEGLSPVIVRNSSGPPKLDLVLWSKLIKCGNKSVITTIHTPVRTTDSVSSEGLDEDVGPRVRGLQTGQAHPHWLGDPFCNDGVSHLNSELTGQLFQSLLTGEVKLNRKESGTRTMPPVFGSLSFGSEQTHEHNPTHSAVVMVTTSLQDSASSPLSNRRWAEVVPDWVVQHLAFLVKKTTQVDQD